MATHIDTPPNKSWVQVTDDALNCSKDATVMVRTYKLPTSKCGNILDYITLGMTPSAVEMWLASFVGSLDDGGVTGSNFTPSNGNSFGLNSYQLQQIEAGQYMLLKCRYEYIGININSLPQDPDVTWEEEVSETWNVGWTTYSVSPYIYCDEVEHSDIRVGIDPDPGAFEPGHAKRSHIEDALFQPSKQKSNVADGPYIRLGSAIPYKLTYAEQQILDKVATGVNPVFHKPIVTCVKVTKSNKETQLPTPQGTLDKISNLPNKAPQVPWNESYIYCGMAISQSKQDITMVNETHPEETKTVTIYTTTTTETWEGARKPDEDFYGDEAWEFGRGPSPAPDNPSPASEPNNGGDNNG